MHGDVSESIGKSVQRMIPLAIVIGALQIYFAFACIDEVRKKGRLNNWWVLLAAFTGFLAYLLARRVKPKTGSI